MRLSSRIKATKASITLTINEHVQKLSDSGKLIYNMTAGQLPFKPLPLFIHSIAQQLNYLHSYQYSPVGGFRDLRKKLMGYAEKKRCISFDLQDMKMDAIISNGSKHTIYNILGTLVDPGDEVIILTPYWVSYPEMIKFWGGVPVMVKTQTFDGFTPDLEEIKRNISHKTKAIIINSPNNPAGIHYSDEWMKDFAVFLKDYPDLMVISDELYSELYYFDPAPTYFYQHDLSLLNQTIIVDGISKSFACTGLRIGYCIAPAEIAHAISKIQSQTTSGPSSLIQRALMHFDFDQLEHFLDPVKEQLRECAQIVREEFRTVGLPHCWYQTTSGFYYLVDFSRTPVFEKYKNTEGDQSTQICLDLLNETGVALVPGEAFGQFNSARMSMTLEVGPFKEGIKKLTQFLAHK